MPLGRHSNFECVRRIVVAQLNRSRVTRISSGPSLVSRVGDERWSWRAIKVPKFSRTDYPKDVLDLRQSDGGHGSWNPLRNVLKRTYRICDRLKLKVVICLARPMVDRHFSCLEVVKWLSMEGLKEQILEVVAIIIKTVSRVHPFYRRRWYEPNKREMWKYSYDSFVIAILLVTTYLFLVLICHFSIYGVLCWEVDFLVW